MLSANETSALLTKQKIKKVNSGPQKQFVGGRSLVEQCLREFFSPASGGGRKEDRRVTKAISRAREKIVIMLIPKTNRHSDSCICDLHKALQYRSHLTKKDYQHQRDINVSLYFTFNHLGTTVKLSVLTGLKS